MKFGGEFGNKVNGDYVDGAYVDSTEVILREILIRIGNWEKDMFDRANFGKAKCEFDKLRQVC